MIQKSKSVSPMSNEGRNAYVIINLILNYVQI